MKKTISALALLACSSLASAASAATFSFKYTFDALTSMTGTVHGSEANGVFVVNDAVFTVTTADTLFQGPSFTFNSFAQYFDITGDVYWQDPATIQTDFSNADIVMVRKAGGGSCYNSTGFCLAGGKAHLTDFNGRNKIWDLNPANFTKIAAVPLPASLPLLAAALGGFGLIARRRKTRAA